MVSAFGKEQEQFLLFQFLLFNISRFRETILIHNFRFPRTPSSIARGYSRGGEGERKRERGGGGLRRIVDKGTCIAFFRFHFSSLDLAVPNFRNY